MFYRKRRPSLHVVVIIPLNFACCTHPAHENHQVRSSLIVYVMYKVVYYQTSKWQKFGRIVLFFIQAWNFAQMQYLLLLLKCDECQAEFMERNDLQHLYP